MCQAIKHGSREAFASHDFCPLFKGQIGRYYQTCSFVGPTDNIK